jgi:hypothetical protein
MVAPVIFIEKLCYTNNETTAAPVFILADVSRTRIKKPARRLVCRGAGTDQ